jgi:hypothetical protein
LANLLEFVTGSDPLRTNVPRISATMVTVDGEVFPAVTFARRQELGGATTELRLSAGLDGSTPLTTLEVSAVANGDGTDQVIARSAVPLSHQPRQFFRLAATFPDLTTLASSPVGVTAADLPRREAGLAVPLIDEDLFVGVAASNTAAAVTFPASDVVSVGGLLSPGVRYYLEVATGPLEGERFDVDTDATLGSGDASVTLALGPDSFSTLPSLAPGSLVGTRLILRRHVTLARLQQLLSPGLIGHDNAQLADAVQTIEGGEFARYFLKADGVTWSRLGSEQDFRDTVLPPDASFLVESKHAAQVFRHAGTVRTNAFRKNLVSGFQSFASGFPQDLSPVQIDAFVDPAAPPAPRWTGNNLFLHADQIELVLGDPPYQLYFLRGDGSTWRTLASSANAASSPIVGPPG